MRTDILTLIAASALALMASCAKEKGQEPAQAGQMRFAVSVEGTKASMTSEDLTQFYIRVTGPNAAFSFFDSIVKDGEVWKASTQRLLWKNEASSITYAAASYGALGADYYNVSITDELFASGAPMGLWPDQSTQEKLNAADLLTMPSTELAYADTEEGVVPITLKHALSKVNFKFSLAEEYFENGVGLETSPVTGLAVNGVHITFSFAPLTGEVTIPSGAAKGAVIPFAGEYKPGTETDKKAVAVFESILVPETLEAGALKLYFSVGDKDFSWTNSTDLTFEPGGEYEIPVSVAYGTALTDPASTTLSLTSPAVGQVIGSDGKNYAAGASLPTGVTKVAMIAYVSGSNGLAIALADEGSLNWETAKSTCEAKTPAFTNGTWKLPTKDEWNQMFSANGGSEESYTGLNTAITTAGGTALQNYDNCWSSTPSVEDYAWIVILVDGDAYWDNSEKDFDNQVRACLAF